MRFLLLALPLAAGSLAAQTSAPMARAAASITAADVARRIGIIADDSMMGRDTPSPGLELTARYVADQFQKFGLRPGGKDGSWFQRYPITRRQLDLAGSRVVFQAGAVTAVARLDRSARHTTGDIPEQPVSGPAIVVGGPLTIEDVGRMTLKDKVVLYVVDVRRPAPENSSQLARAFRLAGPRAVVQLVNVDSTTFAARVSRRAAPRTAIGEPGQRPPVLEVTDAVLRPVLRSADLDLNVVRAATAPVARDVPAVSVWLELKDSVLASNSAPNTIGILEGSDPRLKEEYVVFSAHMDHIGITPGQPDSINNGADDDASGTVGVVELAEAFSRPGARPRRSMLFLTVSGEEKGLWGSRYFSEHPTVPIEQIVADLNIDMVGRNWPDTIVAIGKEHSDLGATLNRVNARHPELGMAAIDDRWPNEMFYFRSDHYNFARKGVPILFFFNGVHPDYHQVSDSPDKIDSDKEARILRLLFHLGQEIANAAARPRWNPESYREIVEE